MALPLPTTVDDPKVQQCLDRLAQQFPAGRQTREFGLVTELPPEANLGDSCYLKASDPQGVLWHLVYDGRETYPWAKVGGPPLFHEVGASETTTSNTLTDLATVGPQVTAPVKLQGFLTLQVTAWNDAPSGYSQMGFKRGANAAQGFLTLHQGGGNAHFANCGTLRVDVAATETVVAKYQRIEATGGTAAFAQRRMFLDPLRVG